MGSTVTDRISGLSTSVAMKAPVQVTTSGNITLSGLAVQAGGAWTSELTAGDRVLVKDQTDATENGIYIAFSTQWRRAYDFNGARDVVKGTIVGVSASGDQYQVTSDNPVVIGTTEITFAIFPDGRTFQSVADLVASGSSLGGFVRTAGYYTPGDGGGNDYEIVAGGTGTADGGSFIDLDNGLQAKSLSDPNIINPAQYGADKFGVLDSGLAINRCFDKLREILSQEGRTSCAAIDGKGCTFRSTISINATKIISWGYQIKNMTIHSEATDKIAVDFTGSRGGHMSDFWVSGDEVSKPDFGLFWARSSEEGFGFCDNWKIENSGTLGHFDRSAHFMYGQETSEYSHCRFWNYNPDGRASILTKSDSGVGNIVSEYATVYTGSASYIQNKYINTDWRNVPIGNAFNVTSISNSNPAVVTTEVDHSYSNGDSVVLGQVNGMPEIENRKYTVQNVTIDSFELAGVDSSAYGTYTSGATVYKANSNPTVLWSEGSHHSFDNCYIVSYGAPCLQIDFQNENRLAENLFDVLFEGDGRAANVAFTNVDSNGSSKALHRFVFKTYQNRANDRSFTSDAVTQDIQFYSGEIYDPTRVPALVSQHPRLFADSQMGNFKLYGVDIVTGDSNFDPLDFSVFIGTLMVPSKGTKINYGIDGTTEDLSGSISISSVSGTIGSYTVNSAVRKRIGKHVTLYIDIDVTDIGTAAGNIDLALPENKSSPNGVVGCGRIIADGDMLQGYFLTNNDVRITRFNNDAVIAGSPVTFRFTMTYELA